MSLAQKSLAFIKTREAFRAFIVLAVIAHLALRYLEVQNNRYVIQPVGGFVFDKQSKTVVAFGEWMEKERKDEGEIGNP